MKTVSCQAFIAASLDGFIARPDGALDWLLPFSAEDEDHGYDAFLADKDGIIMGRGTYEAVRGFATWPYRLPVIVMSRSLTLDDIPEDLAERVAICNLGPAEVLPALAREGWSKVYVDGGALLQSFLREGLLNELTVTHVPVLLGQGLPLFGPMTADIRLVHQSTKTYPSGLVKSHYFIDGAK